ncbi:hypothetical protein Kpol_480p29 [Vanderwaltozyma polyspora DSM 70294]|uniref:Shr3 amino acid permease chaperone n=1 Tax=Vanderwaltozyma polyspora (strain ATCC 22028 / DSM 70294 / BCRC 21397 / CBS 2163 / NBRC 10782 / NRRL Y-8283 / UCD 57-17) TaxID=436907 RepID=A7TP91_VANPO|nr:uncharacterized protein Kpol_480p29 [Vanderwaltozyma polyspora DSM 70294]EDO15942.1 hypothetical protein Kpol_480p29 [Vanderwaltozyma polyspora DSM 70294]
MITYADLCSVGTGLILISSSFLMGVFFANQPYDYDLLFNTSSTQEHFDSALKHYQTLYSTNPRVLYVLLGVTALGFIGSMIRIYKPNPDLQLFEYTSLGLFVFAICVFITNIKTGIECSITHNWGEVNENQGLAVLASSNIIFLLMLVGVILLQGGLWYTNWDYQKRLGEFFAAEQAEQAQQEKQQPESKKQSTKKSKKESKKQK